MPIMLSARKRKVCKVEGEEVAAAPCPPLTPTPTLPPSLVSHHYLLAGRPADRLPPPAPRNRQFVQGENRGNRGTAEGLRPDLLRNFRPSISPAGLVSAVVEAGGGGSCIGSRLILLLARR